MARLALAALAVLLLLLIRFGPRGDAAARMVARGLNLSARQHWFGRRFSRLHALAYSRTRGRWVGRWFGAPVLVIETKGRRSGQTRRTPIIYAKDGERWVVMPANAGDHSTPAWWLNLKVSGKATLLVGGRRQLVAAREVNGVERDRLERLLLQVTPTIDLYRRFTARDLPVVVLEPVAEVS